MNILNSNAAKQAEQDLKIKTKQNVKTPSSKLNKGRAKKTSNGNKTKDKNTAVSEIKTNKTIPLPSTSGLNKGGKPIELSPELSLTESESELSVADEDLCCVCHDWQPVQLRKCQTICFVKWGKCDFCPHWTHLKFCSDVNVLRRDSVFRCPHCLPLEE